VYFTPLAQPMYAEPSSWHLKLTPGCESVNVKVADVWLVELAGPEVIVGSVTVGLAASAMPTAVKAATRAVITTAFLTLLLTLFDARGFI
jgi:hypothetical protein